ncbi:MAG: alpha/beta hydrolase-fold protein [Negativicutes bacterium]|jgi:predicted alpha/beta superfamily hydrolase
MKLFKKNNSGSKVLIEENLFLPHLGCKRNIWIYLPPNYYTNKKLRFPVMYMNDGQNLFDDSGIGNWKLDERLDEYYTETGRTQIIVGIDNGGEERLDEYLPWKKGRAYALDWRETIYPFICRNFRVSLQRERTGFGGSSLGATILLEFIANHQDLIRSFTFFRRQSK